MVAVWIAGSVTALALVAEYLHSRRCRHTRILAFGSHLSPRHWVRWVPIARSLALGTIAWSLCILLTTDSSGTSKKQLRKTVARIMLVLDVSPSMHLTDAGPGRLQTRADRARDLLQALFSEIDMQAVSVSVIAVYNGAKPAVIDCRDPEVIENILSDLPLGQAFKIGKTQLLEGLRTGVALAEHWPPNSTTLILVSDGDTVPDKGMPRIPASINSAHVIGVGDTTVGRYMDGHQSRQNAGKLRSIARRINGTYHDGNAVRIGIAQLPELQRAAMARGGSRDHRAVALAGLTTASAIIALLPLALAIAGIRRKSRGVLE
jgi:Ca-activated chloride channel family protein